MSRCVVTVGTRHYGYMVDRMNNALNALGDTANRITLKKLKTGWPQHELNPYAFKLYALNMAASMGHTSLLWLDSSIIPIKSMEPLWDRIETEGHYLWRSGFNCAQSINDRCLEFFRITRDQAEHIPEVAAGVVGINLKMLKPTLLLERWDEAMHAGVFKGSRTHNPKESKDPRYLHHRQDQSALSLAAFELGLESEEQGNFLAYWPQQRHENTIFIVQGH